MTEIGKLWYNMSVLENKRSFVMNGNTNNRGDDMNESDRALFGFFACTKK